MSAQIYLSIRAPDGTVVTHAVSPGEYFFGRESACDFPIMSADVSRRHMRLKLDQAAFEVEDLASTSGTMLHGKPIKGKYRLTYPQLLELGSAAVNVSAEPPQKAVTSPDIRSPDGEVRITMAVDASDRRSLPVQGVAEQMALRLKMLYDLPLQFAAEPDLKKLYNLILTRVIELIPGAKRGALLLLDSATNKLILRASEPVDQPPISRTLIKRAAAEKQGFIWGDDPASTDQALSIVSLSIRTGMYVPLLWKGDTVGVLCVDNPKHRSVFSHDDLQFMVSVGHYAAAAVANQMLQDDIEQNNRTLQHLLANFSPKLRGKLLQKSREGKLQPGGEKSVVTILMSDLRGFTRTSASLDAETVVAMLNDYFSVLGDIIFQHDGTIDKFIGDAILAVFGSPEPDEFHQLRAVECAQAMQQAMSKINIRRQAKGLPVCDLGVGVHTGEVLHGFIGAEERLEYTVIGDTVNKASRYCDGATPSEVVISPQTYSALEGRVAARERTITTKHEGELQAWALG